MNAKWIVALACGAALALGACSGSNPAPATGTDGGGAGNGNGGTDGNGGAGNGNGGTGDGNGGSGGGTTEEMAFDTKLGEAQTALTMAQQRVTDAETAAQGATTDAERTAAQNLIATARMALTDAVNKARALRALAPDGDNERRGRAEDQIRRAAAAQTADTAKLDAAAQSVVVIGWSGRASLSTRAVRTEVGVVHTARKTDDGDNSLGDEGADLDTALTWDKIPAVVYDPDKDQIVMRPGRDSSSDDDIDDYKGLPMRGLPFWSAINGSGFVDKSDGPLTTATNEYFVNDFVGGLKITSTGLVIEFGDIGRFPAADVRVLPRRSHSYRSTYEFGSLRYDLALTFGTPSASPTGNAEHYWTATLMPNDRQSDQYTPELTDGSGTSGAKLPMGDHYVRLSNHLGEDKRLEPTDGGTDPSDDRNFYLSYAAYGLFDWVPSSHVSANTGDHFRIWPFAVGYDAFKDADDMKVTDVAEADKITAGKFKGQTIGETLVVGPAGTDSNLRLRPPPVTSDAWMLRGDIELTATISGTAGDNKVEGTISNMEQWDTGTSKWKAFEYFTAASLGEGSIGDDGSFSGAVPTAGLTGGLGGVGFAAGFYKGNFYGPLSGLEVAGTWAVPPNTGGLRAIVGSFGAALVREDGTYGCVIQTGGTVVAGCR